MKIAIIELQKQYIRDNGRKAKSITIPRLIAMDLIAQNPDTFGNKTPDGLLDDTLFGMSVSIADEGEVSLGD